MTEDEQTEHASEYEKLLALFISLLSAINYDDEEEALYALAELRTQYTFKHVLKGLNVEYDYAMSLLSNMDDESLTQFDKDMRDRLLAAIQNLIDFSVCEEYQLYNEVLETIGDEEIDFNSEEYQDLIGLCKKYNDTYAAVENSDIMYAGVIAAKWISFSKTDMLVYWTQNDAKVRPSHMALQGYAALKDEFPSWMIPPIDYGCRCFLTSLEIVAKSNIKNIKSLLNAKQLPKLSGVYSESLATCGKIFSSAHPYFSVKEKDVEMLNRFVDKLKEKYHAKTKV